MFNAVQLTEPAILNRKLAAIHNLINGMIKRQDDVGNYISRIQAAGILEEYPFQQQQLINIFMLSYYISKTANEPNSSTFRDGSENGSSQSVGEVGADGWINIPSKYSHITSKDLEVTGIDPNGYHGMVRISPDRPDSFPEPSILGSHTISGNISRYIL